MGLSLYEFGTDRGVGSWNVMVGEQEPVVYNNPPCVSWSAYFQVLSPSNNSIHTSSAHGVWCILTFHHHQLSGVSKLFQLSFLTEGTLDHLYQICFVENVATTMSAKFSMF